MANLKFIARLASFGAAALFLIATWAPTFAAEFPKEFRGLWVTGKSCDNPTAFGLFASDFGVTGGLELRQGKFVVFTFGNDVIQEASADRVISLVPGKEGEDNHFVRELKNGRLYSHLARTPDKVTEGFRCDTLHAADADQLILVRLLHQLDTFVRAYSDIEDKCDMSAADQKPCAQLIVGLLDINGDGKVSPAEVTTFLRHYLPAMALFGDEKDNKAVAGYRTVRVDPGEVAGTEGATAVFGPFLTNIVFSNFDLDGNGFLTADEIAIALKQEGIPRGAGAALRMVGEARVEAADAVGSLGGGLGGMLGGGGAKDAPKP